jgi:hypothetical protein
VLGLASKVMPALLKAMGDRGQDDELRQTWEELRTEMRGYTVASLEQVEDVAEDVAPVVPKRRSGGARKAPEIRVSTKAMKDRGTGADKATKRGARRPKDTE